jgi:hypothetical protein
MILKASSTFPFSIQMRSFAEMDFAKIAPIVHCTIKTKSSPTSNAKKQGSTKIWYFKLLLKFLTMTS